MKQIFQISLLTIILISFKIHVINCANNSGKDIILRLLEDDYDSSKVACAMQFYSKYAKSKSSYSGSYVVFSTLPSKNRNYQNDLVQALSNLTDDFIDEAIVILNQSYAFESQQLASPKTRIYILILDHFDFLSITIDSWMQHRSWNPLAVVFTILDFNIQESTIEIELKKILQVFLWYGMYNVFVVFKNSTTNQIFELASWFPYNRNNCAMNIDDIFLIDMCDSTFGENKSILSQVSSRIEYEDDDLIFIPNDLHKCQLNVSASIWEPYVIYNNKSNENNEIMHWDGIEVVILEIVAKQLNLDVNFIFNAERRTNRALKKTEGLYAAILRG